MFIYNVICSGYEDMLHEVGKGGKCINDNSMCDDNNLISNNIELLRNDINIFIDDNRTEYMFSNPTRFLINDSISDERSDWENDENDEMISLENLRNDVSVKMKKINEALNSAVEKEVIEFAEKEFGEKMTVEEFDWNVENIKSFVILRINGVISSNRININSNKFGVYIDKVSQLFHKCMIIKPILSDPYSDEIYMIFGNKKNDRYVKNVIPINYENYIDFLYAVYSYAIYVLNLVRDIKYKTNSSKIEFINISAQNEYKFVVEKCKKKMELLGIIERN